MLSFNNLRRCLHVIVQAREHLQLESVEAPNLKTNEFDIRCSAKTSTHQPCSARLSSMLLGCQPGTAVLRHKAPTYSYTLRLNAV